MSVYKVWVEGTLRELEKTWGTERSPHWATTRKEFIKENNVCASCGCKAGLNVHHKEPFHIKPELELDPNNLITLCRDHHFFIGHLMDQKSYNVDVEKDSADILEKIKNRP